MIIFSLSSDGYPHIACDANPLLTQSVKYFQVLLISHNKTGFMHTAGSKGWYTWLQISPIIDLIYLRRWAVLFSHPRDYTPVCTTELGQVTQREPDFKKRGCKLIALSCDSVEDHNGWSKVWVW